MAETKNLLLFRKWDLSNIEVVDPGLKTAISLRKQVLPYTFGRSALKRFNKADVNIVERLINKSMHFVVLINCFFICIKVIHVFDENIYTLHTWNYSFS